MLRGEAGVRRPNPTAKMGNSPSKNLLAASARGDVKAVERLVAAGANVDVIHTRYGRRTALYEASENGHVEVVKVLITAGANVDESDDR